VLSNGASPFNRHHPEHEKQEAPPQPSHAIELVENKPSGAEIIGSEESPIHGPKGNVEYLLGIRKI